MKKVLFAMMAAAMINKTQQTAQNDAAEVASTATTRSCQPKVSAGIWHSLKTYRP